MKWIHILTLSRQRTLLGVSILLAVLAMICGNLYINNIEKKLEHRLKINYSSRLVVLRDMQKGSLLKTDDIGLSDFADGTFGANSYGEEDLDYVVGKSLTIDLSAGRLIVDTYLTDFNPKLFLSNIQMGMRAVSIPIDDGQFSSELISEGDWIDLFVSFVYEGKSITVSLLRSVRVIGIGSQSQLSRSASQAVKESNILTVEVNHSDARKIIAAKQNGIISAVLRSKLQSITDDSETQFEVSDLPGILGIKQQKNTATSPKIIYGDLLADLNNRDDRSSDKSTVFSSLDD